MKKFKIKIFGVTVFVAKTAAQFELAMKKSGCSDNAIAATIALVESSHGLSVIPGGEYGRHPVVFIKRHKISTICHESSHITDWIMEDKGIPHGGESTEVRAYLTGFIAEQIASKIAAMIKGS